MICVALLKLMPGASANLESMLSSDGTTTVVLSFEMLRKEQPLGALEWRLGLGAVCRRNWVGGFLFGFLSSKLFNVFAKNVALVRKPVVFKQVVDELIIVNL